jgi:type I restriction-modification system DNA methylase subunit
MSEFDAAFQKVGELVQTFQSNESHYVSAEYEEAPARKDFIDKFFIALGWDVNHDRQKNPYEQEVKVEPSVSGGGSRRRADYAFFLAPNYHIVRFYVEAKKPHGGVATADNYFQTIRYGWNSDTPIAALTSFDHFHVLDCRYKPDVATALNRCLDRYHYTEYADRDKFSRIYWLFSREAVTSGSLEKRAKDLPRHRGKALQHALFPGGYLNIDEAFLAELDEHRSILAKTFKTYNQRLNSETLTELTQRTLDRLVFLRFLEDKGIEQQHLVESFGGKSTAWEDFIGSSRRLDGIYNGVVYKHHDILDSPNFRADSEAFADICRSLSDQYSPYDFNAIPIHILGAIYERFLGKVIVATEKRVRVEDKPEVRKAGGVYYTPEYIVRYIVENTVGKLIEGKTPGQIAEMHFADIACGSGSFLLGVYDLLLNYHGHYYNQNPAKARKSDCVKRDGTLFLSLQKKREILLNNIYGVDIDAQAVEVAQLSLYLKLLQEETTASARQYLLDFEHVARMKKLLPDLSNNIVCGNSLIGTNILDEHLFPSDEERRLNPMNFEDAFPDVMKRGGFDAIVGNPPWLMAGYYVKDCLDYLRKRYATAEGKFDLYYTFIERGIHLTSKDGNFGMIVPNKFFHTKAASSLRTLLSQKRWLSALVDFGDEQVFAGATNYCCLLFLRRQPGPNPSYVRAKAGLEITDRFDIQWSTLSAGPWHFEKSDRRAIFEKLEAAGQPLEQLTVRFGTGVQSGADRILTVDPAVAKTLKLEAAILRPILRGRDVRRYQVSAQPKLLIFPYEVRAGEFTLLSESKMKGHQNVYNRLSENKRALAQRVWFGRNAKELSGEWYGIMYLDSQRWFASPHMLTPSLSNRSNFALGDRRLFATGTAGVTSIIPKDRLPEHILYLLGVLNSTLLSFYATNHSPPFSGGYYKFSAPYLKKLPIRRIKFSEASDKVAHDEIVAKVESMLGAKKELAKAQTDKDKAYYGGKCASLDRQIDRLVYDLYALTEDEIRIVEESANKNQSQIV